jgi:predicted TIM-barrel fold metal-dependent hydrolase
MEEWTMDRATPIIDFHVHFLVRDVLEQCLPHSVATNRGHHILPPHLFALFEKMMTPQGLIGDMDRLQIDMSVISSAAVIEPIYWAEPSVALKMAQQLNDTAAAWVANSPKRIIGSFVLPLQDMNLAMIEFKRAVDDLGLKVANVPAEVRGNYLGDAQFRPFWEAAQDVGRGGLHASRWREGSLVFPVGNVEFPRPIARRGEIHGLGYLRRDS